MTDDQISNSILSQLDAVDRGICALRDRLERLNEQNTEILTAIGRLESPPPAEPISDLLTIKQAAAYLNMSESIVRRMKHLHIRRGRSIRLRRSSLDRTFRADPLAVDRSTKRGKK